MGRKKQYASKEEQLAARRDRDRLNKDHINAIHKRGTKISPQVHFRGVEICRKWNELKEDHHLQNDGDVAKFLLERYVVYTPIASDSSLWPSTLQSLISVALRLVFWPILPTAILLNRLLATFIEFLEISF